MALPEKKSSQKSSVPNGSASQEGFTLTQYLRHNRRNLRQPLDKQEEIELIELSQAGDGNAFEKLLRHHIGYIAKIASEYRHMGIDYEDLLGEGLVGFVQAVYRFHPERRNRFISYAYWWIRKNILLALSNESSPFYVPHYRQQRIFRIRRAETYLIQKLGRRPTLSELAHHMHSTPDKLQSLLETGNLRLRADGLEEQISDEPNGLGGIHGGSRTTTNPHKKWLEKRLCEEVRNAVQTLPRRERNILTRRYGLGSQDPSTLGEIARGMGLTKERVRQIESRAIDLLKNLYSGKTNGSSYSYRSPRFRQD